MTRPAVTVDTPGGDLSGRVLDDSAGLPIAGASVDLHFADPTASILRMNALRDVVSGCASKNIRSRYNL